MTKFDNEVPIEEEEVLNEEEVGIVTGVDFNNEGAAGNERQLNVNKDKKFHDERECCQAALCVAQAKLK